jgi:hypothetical protein
MPSLQNDGMYQDKPSLIDLSGMSCLSNIHAIWNMSGLSLCDIVFYIVYDIVCDIVYDIVHDIVYDMLVLPVGLDPLNDAPRY